MARIVRSQIVKVREEEYIIAAETMGFLNGVFYGATFCQTV